MFKKTKLFIFFNKMYKKRNKSIYKPDSVLKKLSDYHLSILEVALKVYQPTLLAYWLLAQKRTSNPIQDIFGLSAHRVYTIYLLPNKYVCFYHTFSPLPQKEAVIFCYTFRHIYSIRPPVRWYGALCCPDFPLDKYPAIARLTYFSMQKYI